MNEYGPHFTTRPATPEGRVDRRPREPTRGTEESGWHGHRSPRDCEVLLDDRGHVHPGPGLCLPHRTLTWLPGGNPLSVVCATLKGVHLEATVYCGPI